VAKEIDKTIRGLEKYPEAEEYCRNILEKGWDRNIGNTKYTDDSKIGDHYAIIPTGQGFGVLSKLSLLERQVYDLIVRRFLSIFYPPASYSKISIRALADRETFVANSKVLSDAGYLVITSAGEENTENTIFKAIQNLEEGTLIHSEYKINKGKTEPPKRYTSGSIILAMENAGQFIEDEELRAQIKGSGIGTSATRAQILKKLIDISYIKLDQKTQILTPDKEGYLVYDIVKETVPELLTARITAEWEKELDIIAAGEMSVLDHERGIKNYIESHIESIKEKNVETPDAQDSFIREKEVLGLCPECGNDILENEKSFYCLGYKEGCKWSLWKDNKYFAALGKKVTKTFVRDLLNDGYGQVNGLKSKNGNKYYIRLRYVKKDKYYQFEKVNQEE
jgi:DNA topoisomerase-3